MRARKPWVFARRRLFGWNVRLLTSNLPGSFGHDRSKTTSVIYAITQGGVKPQINLSCLFVCFSQFAKKLCNDTPKRFDIGAGLQLNVRVELSI